MKRLILLLIILFVYSNILGQSPEIVKKLTHTPGDLNVTVWNDGFFGPHHGPGLPGSVSWRGTNGVIGSAILFGTKAVGKLNGESGFFMDMANVNSNFGSGFTQEEVGSVTFDQVSTAILRDDNAPQTMQYGYDIIQKTYSKTGENVVFCRNGYVNNTDSVITDLYSLFGADFDIGNEDANSGAVDTSYNLVYVNEPGTSSPLFGLVAPSNNLTGCSVESTKNYNSSNEFRIAMFNIATKINQSSPLKGDQSALIGSVINEISVGDTAWVTFAFVAGDDLVDLKNNAKRVVEIAESAGWTDKIIPNNTEDQIINVPNDYTTIQEAINASLDGDTVLVADGLYYENINFRGKAITLASWHLIDGDETHIDSTIIDGSQPTHPDSGSVVSFHSGEDITSVLCGFTITGGTGSISPPNSGYDAFGGGGISVARGAGAKIHFNKITNNSVSYNNLAAGGGIIIDSPENRVVVQNNYITKNKIFSEHGVGGGIMCINSQPELVFIAGNVISDNQINNGEGGGIYIDDSSVLVRNNLIKNNTSENGIKVICHPDPGNYKMIFMNNTVVYNEGEGFNYYSPNSTPQITNSIFWGNNSSLRQIKQDLGHVSVSYSNIEGSFTGTGNMDQDPLFENTTNYYLSSSSPCVDAGNPDAQYNDLEDMNNIGSAHFPALGDLTNDMGCYGGKSSLTVTDVKQKNAPNNVLPQDYKLTQNYPNPFNPTTIINYSIPKGSIVTIKVFDVLGKEVTTLVNKRHTAGHYQLELNASDLSSGVYFYNLQAGDFVETRKMILMR